MFRVNIPVVISEWKMELPVGKESCKAAGCCTMHLLPSRAAQAAGANKNPGVLQVLLKADIQFQVEGWKQPGDEGERSVTC